MKTIYPAIYILTCDNTLMLPRIALVHGSCETLKQDERSILRSVDDAQSSNDNVMMSDLSARNAIEKFTVFETGPKSFSHKTSGSLHGARSFPITWQAVQFARQNPYPLTFSNLHFIPAREIFLPGIFSKCC